ncbi:unnamed protein product [Phytophthora fragariaefolia]|uniref:Unnamed protein product n=1 Tax=Phytophthora fragariaefolia TaxID=1490495 RepID=A0A9W6XPM7_9STRA|nr:unnamed protein product [Phytophthora fragariaefolia]
MSCYSWPMNQIDETFKEEGANELAKRIILSWPHERLHVFGDGFHLNWTHLYCARGKTWYPDNLINAFATTLAAKYQNNTTIFLPELSTPAFNKRKRIPPRTPSALAGVDKDMVFMPLNINGSHWTWIDRRR